MITFDVQVFYIWLVLSIVFIAWRILTHPLNRIHRASMNGDIETVRQCLEKGVAPDTRKGEGLTSLCLASAKGHQHVVELLINYGADVNQGLDVEHGVNPLLEAALNQRFEVVETLLAHGAVAGIHFAAFQGNLLEVQAFLEQGCSVNSMRNRGMTPLHLAALGGHRDVIELLLDNGADVNSYTYVSETPLHQAVRGNQIEVIELLTERGADLDRIGNLGSALHLAIYENEEDIAELLIDKGADVNLQDGSIESPLHVAAEKGYTRIAQLLLENGADVNLHAHITKRTPLHHAARKGHLETAELLICCEADVNARSWIGSTPLSSARSNSEMMLLLLGYGATDFGSVD